MVPRRFRYDIQFGKSAPKQTALTPTPIKGRRRNLEVMSAFASPHYTLDVLVSAAVKTSTHYLFWGSYCRIDALRAPVNCRFLIPGVSYGRPASISTPG